MSDRLRGERAVASKCTRSTRPANGVVARNDRFRAQSYTQNVHRRAVRPVIVVHALLQSRNPLVYIYIYVIIVVVVSDIAL